MTSITTHPPARRPDDSVCSTRHDNDTVQTDSCWPLNDSRLRWYAYARVAWWHLLNSMQLQSGDNILMPDFICDVMTEPLRRLGLSPRYYESEPLRTPKPADLRPHLDGRTKAVLAVHYFGFPSDLSHVAGYCSEMGVPLIEDATQTMLSRDEDRPIGRYGAAVLFSFRKTLRLPHGAGLLCNDEGLARALARTPAELSKPRRDVWRYWAKRLDQRWLRGNLERFLDAIRARRSTSTAGLANSSSVIDPFEPCLVEASRSARWITLHADVVEETNRRRELFEQLAQRWQHEHLPGRPLMTALPAGWVPYAFVLEPDAAGVERTCEILRALGLAAEPWPRLPADAPADVARRRKVLLLL